MTFDLIRAKMIQTLELIESGCLTAEAKEHAACEVLTLIDMARQLGYNTGFAMLEGRITPFFTPQENAPSFTWQQPRSKPRMDAACAEQYKLAQADEDWLRDFKITWNGTFGK